MKINYTIPDWVNKPITTFYCTGGYNEETNEFIPFNVDEDWLKDENWMNDVTKMYRTSKNEIRVEFFDNSSCTYKIKE